ncbi:uncharacterized protein LOC100821972 [Brachypodium distachyon]|uniref:BAG domain-containing protein n=1 Tax=Brachypodium distachyon TaxID=15368 RepID=I1GPF9_BRADI|nr:uncharacterized protein LOC100821972 [Brachypodium distachyon]KQK13727.1 hypothetical protein BRADI_1g12090v3 [Brachypodium distachyon]|eukprot:XP_003559560.1 uncharacterized protein LOC100821972 [Brachypodium distachyon]
MASRRFFTYDPYDYYYPTPYGHPYSYYQHPSAARSPARNDGLFYPHIQRTEPAVRAAARRSPYDLFPDVESTEAPMGASGYPDIYYNQRPSASARAPARNNGALFPDVDCAEPAAKEARRSVSVPVHFAGPELGPERERETAVATEMAIPKKQAPSAEQAAVRLQASARGFLARRMVREVRAVEREAEAVAARIAAEAEALLANTRARVAIGEELMRLLLRLDAVRGVREYRRRVTKRVLALQDAVDALEIKPAPAPVEMSEESGMANQAAEQGVRIEPEEEGVPIESDDAVDSPATETIAEMDMVVDGGIATSDERDLGEAELMMDGEKAEEAEGENAEEAEGEWEMVAEEEAVAGENPAPKEQQQEPAAEEKEKKAEGGGATDGLDARKVMEMVAAMCEQSAQQCAAIGALAERVDALERAVRRVEVADRRRRRNKKLKKDGKAARCCYSD